MALQPVTIKTSVTASTAGDGFAIGLATAADSGRQMAKQLKRGWPKVYRGNRHERRKAAALDRRN